MHHRAVQFAHAARRAEDKSLTVLHENALGHGRCFIEIFKIRLRNELVEVFKSGLVLDEDYHVPRAVMLGRLYAHINVLNVV